MLTVLASDRTPNAPRDQVVNLFRYTERSVLSVALDKFAEHDEPRILPFFPCHAGRAAE
jgi:hypothetical protein